MPSGTVGKKKGIYFSSGSNAKGNTWEIKARIQLSGENS